MSYLIYLSTDSNDDLSRHDNELFHFEPPSLWPQYSGKLLHPNRWVLNGIFKPSNGFRVLGQEMLDLGFCAQQEWFPEDAADVLATSRFVEWLIRLLENGSKVDCACVLLGEAFVEASVLKLSLNELDGNTFRFFENHHFVFDVS